MRISDWSSDVCSSDLNVASGARLPSIPALTVPAAASLMALPALDPTESVGRFRAPSNAAERSRGRTVDGTGVRRDDPVPTHTTGNSTRTLAQSVEMQRTATTTEILDDSANPRSRT